MRATSRCLAIVALLLVSAAPAGMAEQATDGQKPPPSQVQDHYAQGQVWYEGKWVRMTALLDLCRKARKAMQAEVQRSGDTENRVSTITKTLAELEGKYDADCVPVKRRLAQALAKRSEAARTLAQPPPAKPRTIAQMRGSRGGKKNQKKNRARNQRENKRRQEQYQAALKRYKERREKAQKALGQAEADAKGAARQLEKLHAGLKAKQKPLLTERTRITQEARSTSGRVGAHRSTLLKVAAVLAAVPESVRLRFGVVEWRNQFYSVADLKHLHASIVDEIQTGRKDAARTLTAKGQSLPKTWTHPRQKEADALRALIRGAEADIADAKRAAT